MTEAPPPLFDQDLLARHLARADRSLHRFLAERLAAEVVERTTPILRSFAHTLVTGPLAGAAQETLQAAGCFGALHLAPGAVPEFGCIISLLELQTADDPVGVLIQQRRRLKPDGLLIACLFGGASLSELRAAWLTAESDVTGGASPRVAPMAALRDIGGLLQRAGFALPVADQDRTVLRYADPLALMREVKGLGLSNMLHGRSRRPVTRGLLLRAAAAYQEIAGDPDGRVRATAELIWLTAWAPHESQQQPLKPGSAKMRLADALKLPGTR